MTVQIITGDCLDVLRTLPDCSVDSVVTDPPYGLSDHIPKEVAAYLSAWLEGKPYRSKRKGFMGKRWDSWVPGPEIWRECLRVLKPGGHLLAFAGTRSMDLTCMAVRLAGFELRDSIGHAHDGLDAPLLAWVYGSGFPKSHNLGGCTCRTETDEHASDCRINTPGWSDWQGFGTALKPAWEPIILARKPLEGTVAENVLKHGTGALNIDGCRIETTENLNGGAYAQVGGRSESQSLHGASGMNVAGKTTGKDFVQPVGRWPANLIHDGSDDVVSAFPQAPGQLVDASLDSTARKTQNVYRGMARGRRGEVSRDNENQGVVGFRMRPGARREDEGSAARFFYCAKASRRDRNEGLDDPGPQFRHGATLRDVENTETKGNNHPTVKPTELMRYLCRLVTPPGGTVLDPYMGSGSTGKGAVLEGFKFIGIEREPDYVDMARARIAAAEASAAQLKLFGDAA